MPNSAKFVAATLALCVVGTIGIAAVRVPESCYMSPDGRAAPGALIRQILRLSFKECDPFSGPSGYKIGSGLSITYSFENGSIENSIELRIKPDGAARIFRDRADDVSVPFRLTRADYDFFRDRLAPLRRYSGTHIVDRPENDLLNDPSRKKIHCDSSFSLAPNGLTIIWDWDRYEYVGPKAGSLRIEDISSFDLGCEGAAGPALRARAQPVIDRMKTLARKWAPLAYER